MKYLLLLLTIVLFSCSSPSKPQSLIDDETVHPKTTMNQGDSVLVYRGIGEWIIQPQDRPHFSVANGEIASHVAGLYVNSGYKVYLDGELIGIGYSYYR